MKHLLLAALLTTSIVCLFACQKEPTPAPPRRDVIDYTVLPPITQEGKNTFGCKVNGEVWVPRVEAFVPVNYLHCAYYRNNQNFRIITRLVTNSKNEEMQIYIAPKNLKEGRINLTDTSISSVNYWDHTNLTSYPYFSMNSSANWIDVTHIDTINHIISGIFQFTLKNNPDPNKKISFSDGRFDLKYTPE
jgi:hypothetical protein